MVWWRIGMDSTRKFILITQCVESKPPFMNIDNWETTIGSIETFVEPFVLFDSQANIRWVQNPRDFIEYYGYAKQKSFRLWERRSLWGELIRNHLAYYHLVWNQHFLVLYTPSAKGQIQCWLSYTYVIHKMLAWKFTKRSNRHFQPKISIKSLMLRKSTQYRNKQI